MWAVEVKKVQNYPEDTKKVPGQETVNCNDSDLSFSEVANLPQSIIVGKKVEVTIITKDSNGDHCSTGGHKVFVQLKSFTGNVTVGEVRDNNDGSYVASFLGEQVGEAYLYVSINGQEIRGSPYSIVRRYGALKLPSQIVDINCNVSQPWGVAIGSNGIWAYSSCLVQQLCVCI